jgi:hypothetical protein
MSRRQWKLLHGLLTAACFAVAEAVASAARWWPAAVICGVIAFLIVVIEEGVQRDHRR